MEKKDKPPNIETIKKSKKKKKKCYHSETDIKCEQKQTGERK